MQPTTAESSERLEVAGVNSPFSVSVFIFCAGEATRLVSGGQVVAGRKLSFINDVAVTQDGKKVYFTDSSSRWQRRDYMHLIMEATADGRYQVFHKY